MAPSGASGVRPTPAAGDGERSGDPTASRRELANGDNEEPTDLDLMRRVGGGDRSALALLFQRHYATVHGLCFRITGDPAAAEDLAQESFLRVCRYADSFGGRSAFTSWLYRISRNVCLDHLDAEARRIARRRRAAEMQPAPGPPAQPDPRVETLREALYALPPDKRDVLVLSRYEGLSYAEIAEVCETTVGAVKVRAHRAIRELRKRFEELEKAP